LWANKKKPSGTQQAKKVASFVATPCPIDTCNHFKKRLCDKQDEISVELRDSDDAQLLSGDEEDAELMF
jgi:hypothetical protein